MLYQSCPVLKSESCGAVCRGEAKNNAVVNLVGKKSPASDYWIDSPRQRNQRFSHSIIRLC